MTPQVNLLVSEDTKRNLEILINEKNNELLRAGYNSLSKSDWMIAGTIKFLTGNLSFKESLDWAKRKQLIEKFVEEVKKTLEEAHHV